MTPRSYNFTSAETPEFSEALQEQIRSLLLVCFGKKLTPTEAISYIDDLEHGLSVHITTIRLWYRRFELGDFTEVLKLCLHHVHRGASEQLWSVLFDQFDEQARAISEVEAVRFQLLAVLQGIQVMSTILSKGASVGNYKPLFQHCHESFELAQALPLDTLGTA
ncbi:hypothetical protein H4S03_006137 [Coemansia sp. S3946]|nr:hypothetical protein H4S03_006137 [Coemansia sp. S3946]